MTRGGSNNMTKESIDNLWLLDRDSEAIGGWIICSLNGNPPESGETYAKYKSAQSEALRRNSNEVIKLSIEEVVTDFEKDDDGNTIFWLRSDYEEEYQAGNEGWLLCDNIPFKACAKDFIVVETDDGELTLKPTGKLLAIKKYHYFNLDNLPDNVEILDGECDQEDEYRDDYIDSNSQYYEEYVKKEYIGDSNYEPLLNLLTRELYQINPFRVLGLPINASMKEIDRKKKSLGLSIELGISPDQIRAGLLPLEPAPDRELINKSIEQLRNPHSRLIYGLFWFWPLKHSKNEGMNLLCEKKLKDALQYWHEKESLSNSGSIAKHNMAILYHLTALDIEHEVIEGVATEKEIEICNSHWKSTYTRWLDLINSDFFGDCLSEHLQDIDDVRLTSHVVRNIRHTLPRALLSINAELAVNASSRDDSGEVKRHIDIMNSSGFNDQIIQQVLRDATKPIVERIHSLCSSIIEKSNSSPGEANKIVVALLNEIKPLLNSLYLLSPSVTSFVERCHDEVAAILRECVVIYGNETADWKECLKLSSEVESIALGASFRDRVKEDIDFIKRNLELEEEQKKVEEEHERSVNSNAVYDVLITGDRISVPPLCTCCLREADKEQAVSYSWTEQKAVSKVERTLSFNFPVCGDCVKHQSQLRTKRFFLIILSSLISVGLLYLIGSESSRFEYVEYIVPGGIISLIALVILSFLFRVRKLDSVHATRNEAVDMVNANSDFNMATFRFSNYLYALAFARANNKELTKKSQLRYSRNRSLLRGRSGFQVFIWVAILSFIGHSILYSILDDSWNSKNTYGASTYSKPSTSYTTRNSNYSQGKSSLISQINTGKQQLKRIKLELGQMDSSMEAISTQINSAKTQINNYESSADNGQYVNQYSYNSTLENHNSLVNKYNAILAKRRVKYSEYEREFKRVNDLIGRYNRR